MVHATDTCADACNLYGIQSVYDDHGGQAIAQEEGQAIAAALGPDNLVCILKNHGLLTVGRTVDEAAFLFYSLDQACHSQLLAEAAAANGVSKSIIADKVAQYSAEVIQSAVRVPLHSWAEREMLTFWL